MFLPDGVAQVVFATSLDIIQYQITFVTMMFYFQKIMSSILPNVQQKWSKILYCSYILQSLILVSITMAVIIRKA